MAFDVGDYSHSIKYLMFRQSAVYQRGQKYYEKSFIQFIYFIHVSQINVRFNIV